MPATIIPEQDAVVGEIEIAAPPERVFQALTDPAQLRHWFKDSDCPVKLWEMDARLGGRYGYATDKGSIMVNNVNEFECHGEILEYDPPRVLVYTWIANWHDEVARRTEVRWELTPKSGGTQVRVTHSGLRNLPIARKDYTGGWPGVLESLKKFTES
jgi:uncharacterized protein YndB with AHSA1/START domain